MTKTDLPVPSKYSNHPSGWFLQRLGVSSRKLSTSARVFMSAFWT